MLRIKRTKTVTVNDVKNVTTHYAAAVDPNGSISGWTSDSGKAAAITSAAADRVRAYYAGVKNAGQFEFEPVSVSAEAAAKASAAELVRDVAAVSLLQKQVAALQAELRAANGRTAAIGAERDALKNRVADVEAALAKSNEQVAALERIAAEKAAAENEAANKAADEAAKKAADDKTKGGKK